MWTNCIGNTNPTDCCATLLKILPENNNLSIKDKHYLEIYDINMGKKKKTRPCHMPSYVFDFKKRMSLIQYVIRIEDFFLFVVVSI